MRSPWATTRRCTWCWIISASASNSGASGAMVTSLKVASSRTASDSQRPSVDDRALQPGVGEDAEPIAVAHQHAAGAVRLHRRRRRRRCWSRHRRHAPGAGRPRRPATSSAPATRAGCGAAPARRALRQVREQQRAEGRVARDQRVDRGLAQSRRPPPPRRRRTGCWRGPTPASGRRSSPRARRWRPARPPRTARRGP